MYKQRGAYSSSSAFPANRVSGGVSLASTFDHQFASCRVSQSYAGTEWARERDCKVITIAHTRHVHRHNRERGCETIAHIGNAIPLSALRKH